MKGFDNVLHPLQGNITEPSSTTAHPLFQYATMPRLSSLQDTLLQYPPELLSLLGHCPVTDNEGYIIMTQLGLNNASAGSDGSVKDGIGGHSFCIATNTFSHHIWGQARSVGHTEDMSSLRTEHAGALGVLLLLYGMHVYFPHLPMPNELTLYIDNSEVVRRGECPLPHLVLSNNWCWIMTYGQPQLGSWRPYRAKYTGNG